ncbi:calcium/sodium antiporter [Halostagnicola kamekurae]|uniref:Cation:H+ antiporter n=1 Tax=Halostagnicola kamekurae TaxID=619731 RepID=A0A1I6RVI9_9EURY|nr:calcium/sodium antiporter [Halostagnicola kamekurae]SFS68714.1 cation:H+ antiporter [Halostagnicola kamekurae]
MPAGSELLVPIALLVVGIVALYAGAELLVAGAGRLALGVGLRAATVGVTVIAFATTAPELFVAITGVFDVSTDIGLGTVLGSNVANIGLVLGVSALIKPLSVSEVAMKRHVPFMVLAAVLLVGIGLDGVIGRLEGALLIAVLAGFTVYLVHTTNADQTPAVDEPGAGDGIALKDVALVLVGLITLVVGSQWLIEGGTELLFAFGFSELFIGLTVLAIGTSLPELAASAIGAARGETEFAIGNVVGSNIYNVLAVLGIVALITPIQIATSTIQFEFPALIVFTLVLVAMMSYGRKLTRLDGFVLVAGYAGFIYFLAQ